MCFVVRPFNKDQGPVFESRSLLLGGSLPTPKVPGSNPFIGNRTVLTITIDQNENTLTNDPFLTFEAVTVI